MCLEPLKNELHAGVERFQKACDKLAGSEGEISVGPDVPERKGYNGQNRSTYKGIYRGTPPVRDLLQSELGAPQNTGPATLQRDSGVTEPQSIS